MVLDEFNIDIKSGSKIALIGHSGCGKSTITNLILRFYNILDGQITIDDLPIEQYDVLALRDQIGFVMQEPILFNTSIRENIAFGKPDATDEEIFKAAFRANAIEFIETIKEIEHESKSAQFYFSQIERQATKELKNETEFEKEERLLADKASIHESLKTKYGTISVPVDQCLALLSSIDKKLVLMEAFKYADEKAIQLIGAQNETFMRQVEELN
jgi:ABC-type sugar transport system ATPase subunit